MAVRFAILPNLILALLAAAAAAQQPPNSALPAAGANVPVGEPGAMAPGGGAIPGAEGLGVADAAPAASGDVVLASAVGKLARYSSISASIRQRVGLFGHDLFGSGQYVQRGVDAKRKLRLEMTIQGKRQKSSATRICDGRLLYLLDDIGGHPTLRVVDLRRVEDALAQADQARATEWRRFDLGFGGLPRLLAACEENFSFAAAYQSQLNDVPVWVLRGHWKADRLQVLLAGQGGAGPTKNQQPTSLPAHMPNEVVLYLGRDDLFPYCIEYRSVREAQNKQGTESHILAAMDFFDVRLDLPVDETQFVGPANMAQTDDTEAYITRLGIPRTPREIRDEQKK